MKAHLALIDRLQTALGGPLSAETLRLIAALSDEAYEAGREAEAEIRASNEDPSY